MQRTLTIARREFVGYFNGPAAYIVVCLFMVLMGLFFWNPFFLINRATMSSMFDLMSVLLLPTAPAMTMGLLAVLLLLTLPYPFSVASLGRLDWGPVIGGYIALLLQGASMLAIGVLASSWTENQLIAFFTSGMICFALWIVTRFLPFLPEQLASAVEWVSFDYHFSSMMRGVIDSRDVIYFLSVIGFSLALAFRSLESRRWS